MRILSSSFFLKPSYYISFSYRKRRKEMRKEETVGVDGRREGKEKEKASFLNWRGNTYGLWIRVQSTLDIHISSGYQSNRSVGRYRCQWIARARFHAKRASRPPITSPWHGREGRTFDRAGHLRWRMVRSIAIKWSHHPAFGRFNKSSRSNARSCYQSFVSLSLSPSSQKVRKEIKSTPLHGNVRRESCRDAQ